MRSTPTWFALLCLLAPGALRAESAWHASWITHPTAPLREPIVLHFRRELTLASAPATYPVRVSADNRFILFVNGVRVGTGPARGDLAHWRYETFDLAPHLHPGRNVIGATVWNFGILAPLAQDSDRTAFLLESDAGGAQSTSTPTGWMVEVENGHRARLHAQTNPRAFWAAGPGEEIDASQMDWSWNIPGSGGGHWVPADFPMRDASFRDANLARGADTPGDNSWCLMADPLPPMEELPISAGRPVRGPTSTLPVTLPPNSHVRLLFDRETLATAYPKLTVSGGRGSSIVATYAEALYDQNFHKADRNEIAGRAAYGLTDRFLPDGGNRRVFQPLWWRSWRYLDLEIQTAGDPLTVDSLDAIWTAYPFQARASLRTDDPELGRIWDISWRTARVNAHETYSDTPSYEQLQYIGDTRIQALISYAVSGDDRLARQALDAFSASRVPDGLTQSRYPSSLRQMIPTFSLLWIGMVHDWWRYRPDPSPVREALPGIRGVLDWFSHYEMPDGLLAKVPGWSFIDWISTGVIPSYSATGESCVTTLEYLGALDQAADLESAFGLTDQAKTDRAHAARIRSALYLQGWSADRRLLADNPDRTVFSQHANLLAVLYDVVPRDRQPDLMERLLAIQPGTTPDGVLSASYYFRFYLARALDHAGMADRYLDELQPWRALLPLHFSTWPEMPGDTRSDSHAWSAHPIYDLLTLVAGIAPGSPGFATVRISPHLGSLPSLSADFPHPAGLIHVDYRRRGQTLEAAITLPGTLTGTFDYHGSSRPLQPGANQITLP